MPNSGQILKYISQSTFKMSGQFSNAVASTACTYVRTHTYVMYRVHCFHLGSVSGLHFLLPERPTAGGEDSYMYIQQELKKSVRTSQ